MYICCTEVCSQDSDDLAYFVQADTIVYSYMYDYARR